MSIHKKGSCSWPECAWISEQIDLFAGDKRAVSGNELAVHEVNYPQDTFEVDNEDGVVTTLIANRTINKESVPER